MRTLAAGPGGVFAAGQVAEFDDETAEAMIAGGAAEAVETGAEAPSPEAEAEEAAGGEPETATAEPPERAVQPRPRRRKAKG